MMRSACLILCLLLCLVLTAVGVQAQADSTRDAAVDKVFSFVKGKSPGCSLAVIRNGETVLKRGYGFADLDHDIPITSDSVFHIASISKQFTAMAIQMLAQQGKVSLDDDIHKYFPELKGISQKITIRHLLHHTSGLRDQWNLLIMSGWRLSDDVVKDSDVLDLVSRMRHLNFEPGEQHLYCNTGYTLLALIVKRVSGRSLAQFADANIFKPLGMNQTLFRDDHLVIVPKQAYAYNGAGESLRLSVPNYDTVGASSMLTTVEDLAKWDQNFYDFKVGGPEVSKAMQVTGILNSGEALDYASGLVIGRYKGLKIVEHSGADAGYRANLLRFPEERLSVACLCNWGSTNPSVYSRQIADIFLADRITPQPQPSPTPGASGATLTQTQLSKRVGSYWRDLTEDLARVTLGDGKLFVTLPGYSNSLEPLDERRFRLANNLGEAVFDDSPGGTSLRVTFANRKPLIFAALPPAIEGTKHLAEFAGNYFSSEIESTYRIDARDGKLFLSRRKFDPVELRPVFRDGFTTGNILGTIRFKRDKAGKITGMTLSAGRIRSFQLSRVGIL